MNSPVVIDNVKNRIVTVRGEVVLIDRDVAALYGVETRRVNEAVKNNPDKFPTDYMFALTKGEMVGLRSKISTANVSPKSRVLPKAFTNREPADYAKWRETHMYVGESVRETAARTRGHAQLADALFPRCKTPA